MALENIPSSFKEHTRGKKIYYDFLSYCPGQPLLAAGYLVGTDLANCSWLVPRLKTAK